MRKGAPNIPRGWMGLDGIDLDHKITFKSSPQNLFNEESKKF